MLSPSALHKIIPPGVNDPRLAVVDGAVLHVAVSHAASLHDLFTRDGGIESHFYVRRDGTVEQYRDCDYEADAQSAGNSWIGKDGKRHGLISIETEGMGPGQWTPAQMRAIQKLLLELSGAYGFPLRKIRHPFGRGVGYHRQFHPWNPDYHSCPGDDRVEQFDNELVPWMRATKRKAGRRARFQPRNYFVGAEGPWVTWLGRRLVAHGFTRHHEGAKYTPGPTFTRYDRANVRDFQRAQGWTGEDADGLPGRVTLRRLARKPKPTHKRKRHRKPVVTRIDRFLNRYDQDRVLDLALLDRAVAHGRKGKVADVLANIEAQVERLR